MFRPITLPSLFSWNRKRRGPPIIIFCGIVLTLLICFLYLFQPLLLSTLDLRLYDAFLRFRKMRATSGSVVIVDIDSRSLTQYGQWPWPRYRLAQLLEKVRAAGAATIGVDILLPEPDRSSLNNVQRRILKEFHYRVDLTGVPRRYLDNDIMLAEALKQGPFILGHQFLFDEGLQKEGSLHPVNLLIRMKEGVPDSANPLYTPSSTDSPYRPLAEAAPSSGFVNVKPDHDGIIRRVPLLMEYHGRYFAHLSLALLLQAYKPEQMVLTVGDEGTEVLDIDGLRIPLGNKGTFLIPFHGPHGTYPHISASDILSGKTTKNDFAGKIVIVGTSAPGLLDIRATPTDPAMSGAEVHANIVDALIRGDFTARPQGAVAYEFAAVVILGLLSTFLLTYCRAATNLAFLFLFVPSAVVLPVFLVRSGIYLSPLYPLLAYTSNFSLLSFLHLWREERLLREKTKLQLATQEAMLETVASITETRDPETGGHIRRTRSYVETLACHIRTKPEFMAAVDDAYMEDLLRAAPLHDLGKVGVPDSILFKPGRLTSEEFEEIKKHTRYGKRVIDAAQAKLGGTSFLKLAGEMALSHHEYWNGQGYPDGLKGKEIPLSGRIMAIADVYDALISDRPYKKGLPHEQAVEIILEGCGSQFDPELIDAFKEVNATFETIARRFADAGLALTNRRPDDPLLPAGNEPSIPGSSLSPPPDDPAPPR